VPGEAKAVYNSWGPGKYDPRFNIDGQNTPLVMPPAYGLHGVKRETYTGDGPVSYWNRYVAVTQMGGHGTFVDKRLGIRNVQKPDLVAKKLAPLRFYQLKSALKMQRVQPQMKAIQEKYKKYSMRDPRKQEMNKEIADLYKRENVNPASGCLPLLIQMPFFIAYYKVLSTAIDLRQAHWLWIRDLSAADPYFILTALVVVSFWITQKMTPQAGMDPAQQRMMNIMMPLMMGFFFFRMPAGLNLYYALSNVIMILQTWVMNRTELGREMREIAAKRARKKDK